MSVVTATKTECVNIYCCLYCRHLEGRAIQLPYYLFQNGYHFHAHHRVVALLLALQLIPARQTFKAVFLLRIERRCSFAVKFQSLSL
jgi:hypothetical protein